MILCEPWLLGVSCQLYQIKFTAKFVQLMFGNAVDGAMVDQDEVAETERNVIDYTIVTHMPTE